MRSIPWWNWEFQQWFCMQDRKMGLCHFSPRSQLLPSVPKKSQAILSPVPHHCISTAHRTSIYDLGRAMSKPDIFLFTPVGTAVRKMPRAWVAKPLALCSDSSSSLEFLILIFQTEQPCDLQTEIKLKTERRMYHESEGFFWQEMCEWQCIKNWPERQRCWCPAVAL